MERLEELCKKPNALRLLLLLDGERKQSDVYHSQVVSTGAFYGALKDLMRFGLIERYQKEGIYYLRPTEKGKKIREHLAEIAKILSE